MEISVLAVEDKPRHVKAISRALETELSPDDRRRYGINAIKVVYVGSKQKAIEAITTAVKEGRPFDILLLDIMLPERDPIPSEEPIPPEKGKGIEVLTAARELQAAKEILIYSVLRDFQVAVDVFLGGAVDFIPKNVVGPELLTRVLAAGARLLERENARLLEQRLKDLVPYAETGLARRLGACFSRFVQSVINESEGLAEGLKERWGLDMQRDAQDSQVRHLLEVQDAIQQAKREWTDIVSSLIGGEEKPRECIVEDALTDLYNKLLPSLALNHVELTGDWQEKTFVRTFRDGVDDVKAVLKEILLGALSEQSTLEAPGGKIDVKVITNDSHAEVQFRDSFTRIDGKAVCSINRGIIIPPGRTFGRAWGLSVAQHLAQRGGGKLKVESDEDSNVITYSIPLADHAKSAPDR
jgi:CheY-like chemotaxis protein